MGEKKKNEAWVKTLSKIFIVFACLLFVGLMILSGMGNQWITMFNSVKSGDTVVLDVTVYDAAGKPIITSEQTVYNQAVAKGQDIFATKQLTVISNKTLEKSIFGVPGLRQPGQVSSSLRSFHLNIMRSVPGLSG